MDNEAFRALVAERSRTKSTKEIAREAVEQEFRDKKSRAGGGGAVAVASAVAEVEVEDQAPTKAVVAAGTIATMTTRAGGEMMMMMMMIRAAQRRRMVRRVTSGPTNRGGRRNGGPSVARRRRPRERYGTGIAPGNGGRADRTLIMPAPRPWSRLLLPSPLGLVAMLLPLLLLLLLHTVILQVQEVVVSPRWVRSRPT